MGLHTCLQARHVLRGSNPWHPSGSPHLHHVLQLLSGGNAVTCRPSRTCRKTVCYNSVVSEVGSTEPLEHTTRPVVRRRRKSSTAAEGVESNRDAGRLQQHTDTPSTPGSNRHAAANQRVDNYADQQHAQVPGRNDWDKQLTARIMRAQDIFELQQILLVNGHRMNHIHLTAFIVALARVAQKEQLTRAVAQDAAIEPLDADMASDMWNSQEQTADGASSVWNGSNRGPAISRQPAKRQHSKRHTTSVMCGKSGRGKKGSWEARRAELEDLTVQAIQLLQPCLVEMDDRGLVNALYGLGKLGMRHAVCEDLLYLSMQFMSVYKMQAFSNLIYAAGLLRVKPSREWLTAFFRHTLPLLPACTPQQLSNTLWGLARLKLAPGVSTSSRDWEKAMYVHVARLINKPDGCPPQALCNIVWSIARMDLYPADHFLETCAAAARRQLMQLSPQGLANLLWGLARMRAPLSQAWWHSFKQATYKQLDSYSPVVLATFMYSMALLGHAPTTTTTTTSGSSSSNNGNSNDSMPAPQNSWYQDSTDSHTTTNGSKPAGSSSHIQKSLANGGHLQTSGDCQPAPAQNHHNQPSPGQAPVHVREEGARLGFSSDVSAHGFRAALGVHSPPQLQLQRPQLKQKPGQLPQQLKPQPPQPTPQKQPQDLQPKLASVCVDDVGAWAAHFQHCLAAALLDSPAYTISNVMYSWGKLRTPPGHELMQALLSCSQQLLPGYTPQGLANTIWALARMEAKLGHDWVQAYLASTYEKMHLMNAQELSNVVWALARLHVWPDGLWMSRFEALSLEVLQEYEPQALSNTLHALACLRYMPGREWQASYIRRLDAQSAKLSAVQLVDVMWGAAELRLQLPTELSSRLAATITPDMTTITSSEVASTLYAMTRMQLPLPHSLLSAMVAEIGLDMASLDLRTMAQLSWALSCAQYVPTPAWMAQFDSALLIALAQPISGLGDELRPPTANDTPSSTQSTQFTAQSTSQPSGRGNAGMDMGMRQADLQQQQLGAVKPGMPTAAGARPAGPTSHVGAYIDALCQIAAVRPRLGPVRATALPSVLLQRLGQPGVLGTMTAPQMLLAVQGVMEMGYQGSTQDVLSLLTQGVQQHMQAGGRFQGVRPLVDTRPVTPPSRPIPKPLAA